LGFEEGGEVVGIKWTHVGSALKKPSVWISIVAPTLSLLALVGAVLYLRLPGKTLTTEAFQTLTLSSLAALSLYLIAERIARAVDAEEGPVEVEFLPTRSDLYGEAAKVVANKGTRPRRIWATSMFPSDVEYVGNEAVAEFDREIIHRGHLVQEPWDIRYLYIIDSVKRLEEVLASVGRRSDFERFEARAFVSHADDLALMSPLIVGNVVLVSFQDPKRGRGSSGFRLAGEGVDDAFAAAFLRSWDQAPYRMVGQKGRDDAEVARIRKWLVEHQPPTTVPKSADSTDEPVERVSRAEDVPELVERPVS
jgi:hypothetical protein